MKNIRQVRTNSDVCFMQFSFNPFAPTMLCIQTTLICFGAAGLHVDPCNLTRFVVLPHILKKPRLLRYNIAAEHIG